MLKWLMFIILLLAFVGAVTGYFTRKWSRFHNAVGAVAQAAVYLLLLTLGIGVGINDMLFRHLPRLGGSALILAGTAILGSLIAGKILHRLAFSRTADQKASDQQDNSADLSVENASPVLSVKDIRGSLIIIACFSVGVLWGRFLPVPAILSSSMVILYGFMFIVGMTIGGDSGVIEVLRYLNWKILLVPVSVVFGSLLGAAAGSFAVDLSIREAMASQAGFGYYSLSSIILSEIHSTELGTIALLANIFREIFTLIAAPLLVRLFSPLGPVVSGGATSMDTTLPVVSRFSGSSYVVISLFNGVVLTILVPFIVPVALGS